MSKYLPEGWTQDKIDQELEFQRKRKEKECNNCGGQNDIILSEKEQELYYYIGTRENNVTVKSIETDLGKEYVGALGRLLHLGKIKSEKKNLQIIDDANPYSRKWTKVFFVKKDEK